MTAADAAVCRCGHPKRRHSQNWGCEAVVNAAGACPCAAFVADVNRPETCAKCFHPKPLDGSCAATTAYSCAAASDRGAGELADLLGRHRHYPPMQTHGGYMENGCSCGVTLDRPDMAGDWAQAALLHDAHTAAVLIAAGWGRA